MKKIFLILSITTVIFGCDENLSDLNIDPKNPREVDASVLFTYGQYNLVKQMTNIDYNHNVDRFWANFLTQTTYIQESNYDAANRDIGGSIWDNIFTESLIELKRAKEILRAEEISDALKPIRDNKIAMIKVLEVFAYQYLVDNFGPVPFNEALDINNVTPEYTPGDEIYAAITDSLNAAIASFDANKDGFSEEADILYGGDIEQWQKFANSLLLKIGIRLSDVNETKAKELVIKAVQGGVFESNADNATFDFIATQPYTNPVYDYFFVDKRASDFVVSADFLALLQGLSDPRLDIYLDDNIADGYVGGVYGASGNAYNQLTHIDPMITQATYPGTIMDYAFVEFTLAEAVERGFISGDAAEHYEDAIRASFSFWGLSSDMADTYLAQPEVAYATAEGTYEEKIGRQKYIALFNQGHEAWTEARRLDHPQLAVAANSGVPNPKRMIYPVTEVLINEDNFNAAASILGGDKTSSPIFWDVD